MLMFKPDRQTDEHAGRQTDRQIDTQADRQIDTQAHRQRDPRRRSVARVVEGLNVFAVVTARTPPPDPTRPTPIAPPPPSVSVSVRMDGWLDGWLDAWMEMDGWMDGSTPARTSPLITHKAADEQRTLHTQCTSSLVARKTNKQHIHTTHTPRTCTRTSLTTTHPQLHAYTTHAPAHDTHHNARPTNKHQHTCTQSQTRTSMHPHHHLCAWMRVCCLSDCLSVA
jgi:hypothetical protein